MPKFVVVIAAYFVTCILAVLVILMVTFGWSGAQKYDWVEILGSILSALIIFVTAATPIFFGLRFLMHFFGLESLLAFAGVGAIAALIFNMFMLSGYGSIDWKLMAVYGVVGGITGLIHSLIERIMSRLMGNSAERP